MHNEFDDALPAFVVEAQELLTQMETALLGFQADGADTDVDALFRAAHTIKGSGGLFGLTDLVAFTHVCESLLDEVREGRISVDAPMVALLLGCVDHLRQLVQAAAEGCDEADRQVLVAAGEPLLVRLRLRMQPAPPAPPGAAPARAAAANSPAAAAPPGGDHWHLSLRFGPDVLRQGMDPMSVLRYLGTLGQLLAVETVASGLPAAQDMDPESCYLGFEIALQSDADKARIDGAFDFVRDDCAVRILPPHSRIAEFVQLVRELPEGEARIGELLVRCGSVTAHELDAALRSQAAASADPAAGPPPPIGAVLVAQQAVAPAVVEAALRGQGRARDARQQEARSVRVDADRLEQLINLVGELITATASSQLAARRCGDAEVAEYGALVGGLVEEVRDSALALRTVKIGATFSRFQRVVYDVSRELGKDIRLELAGEDTELDKTVVEKIGDPLMHLVRNAMDHGIEPAEQRLAAGKPAHGTLSLSAGMTAAASCSKSATTAADCNRDRILAKAVERGLVEPGKTLSDADAYALIFEPGFSTAEQVTNLSGRGVGMDVVRSNITALRGNVALRSRLGQGTTVEIRLPLTLAIIHGFQVAVGDSVFVLPLEMVEECIEFAPDAASEVISLRGQALPFVRLRDHYQVRGSATQRRQSIVIVRHLGRRAGLVVDNLLGESQTVIKPLGTVFSALKGLAGSSVLGSGEVALIIDVPELLQQLQGRPLQPRLAAAA